MVRGIAYVVFVIPAAFTVVFSSIVLASALDSLDRELNMWPSTSHGPTPSIEILGLQDEYAQGEVLEFQIHVKDNTSMCGDVIIKIYDSNDNVADVERHEYECVVSNSQLLVTSGYPINNIEPGSYTITIIINTHDNQLIGSAVFYIR